MKIEEGKWYYHIETHRRGLLLRELEPERRLRKFLLIDENGREFVIDEHHIEPLEDDDD